MRLSLLKRRWLRRLALPLTALGLAVPPAWAQQPISPYCPIQAAPPSASCPNPRLAPPLGPTPAPSPSPSPGTTPAPTPAPAPSPAPEAPQTPEASGLEGAGLGGAAGVGAEFAAAPNMQGDLLLGTRSLGYFLNRVQNGVFVNNLGATTITNAAVADNASPAPRDRVSFRYNHFSNVQSVTGISDAPPTFNEALGAGVRQQTLQGRSFDVDLYTFQFEKTFLDGRVSVEARLPFGTGLAPTLNLSVGDIRNTAPAQVMTADGNRLIGFFNPVTGKNASVRLTPDGRPVDAANAQLLTTLPAQGFVRLQGFTVGTTASQTRGAYDTQLGDLTTIFKGILFRNDTFLLSGGLALSAPTGGDTHTTVTDFVGGATNVYAETQRVRDFVIHNETWALSPFVAGLWVPNQRFFAQGFLQFELPVNSNSYSFTDTFPAVAGRAPATLGLTPATQNGRIDEQSLMHVDIGAGYWVLRNPSNQWLTGLAPTIELHYTSTLDNADVVVLPGDNSKFVPAPLQKPIVAPSPTIGSQRNRVDILNLNLGATALIGERATLGTSVILPLRGVDNRTFDWEVTVQLNVFFGGSRPQGQRVAPNF